VPLVCALAYRSLVSVLCIQLCHVVLYPICLTLYGFEWFWQTFRNVSLVSLAVPIAVSIPGEASAVHVPWDILWTRIARPVSVRRLVFHKQNHAYNVKWYYLSIGFYQKWFSTVKDIWYVSDIFFKRIFPTSSIWRVFRDKFSIFYCINFTQERIWSSIA
jgi:hypothetical protein